MALPPSIPTSFVPRSTTEHTQRFRADFSAVFSFFAYGVLAISIALAAGVFFYERSLATSLSAKNDQLKKEQDSIDEKTIKSFIQLRDRLVSSKSLLDGHIAYSGFFALLEKMVPTHVHFTGLSLSKDDKGVPKFTGSGVAKNFNALAFASNVFASDSRVKDAIFSSITINKDSTVSFSISASLDPEVTVFPPTMVTSTIAEPIATSTRL